MRRKLCLVLFGVACCLCKPPLLISNYYYTGISYSPARPGGSSYPSVSAYNYSAYHAWEMQELHDKFQAWEKLSKKKGKSKGKSKDDSAAKEAWKRFRDYWHDFRLDREKDSIRLLFSAEGGRRKVKYSFVEENIDGIMYLRPYYKKRQYIRWESLNAYQVEDLLFPKVTTEVYFDVLGRVIEIDGVSRLICDEEMRNALLNGKLSLKQIKVPGVVLEACCDLSEKALKKIMKKNWPKEKKVFGKPKTIKEMQKEIKSLREKAKKLKEKGKKPTKILEKLKLAEKELEQIKADGPLRELIEALEFERKRLSDLKAKLKKEKDEKKKKKKKKKEDYREWMKRSELTPAEKKAKKIREDKERKRLKAEKKRKDREKKERSLLEKEIRQKKHKEAVKYWKDIREQEKLARKKAKEQEKLARELKIERIEAEIEKEYEHFSTLSYDTEEYSLCQDKIKKLESDLEKHTKAWEELTEKL
ncbi:hypothetical protein ACFLY6_03285 [Candidatus Dependentiae bacterium]